MFEIRDLKFEVDLTNMIIYQISNIAISNPISIMNQNKETFALFITSEWVTRGRGQLRSFSKS